MPSEDSRSLHTPKYSAASQTGNIQPVNPVNKKNSVVGRKAKKNTGAGAIIAIFIIFAVIFAAFFFLEKNDDLAKIFGINETTAIPTSIVQEEITETTTEATTKATTETTTEATTKATTETTTEATTTEETTEETTEATTTEATSATTTAATPVSGAVYTLTPGLTNVATTSNGFSFDLTLQNFGSQNAVLNGSVKTVVITLYCDQTIESVTSSDYTFVQDPNNANSYIGTPKSTAIAAGTTLSTTVTVTTSSPVSHYRCDYYCFNWNK